MIRYRLAIAYDGTHYGGWQVQKNSLTIQEVLQKTLSKLLNQPIRIAGAGRTDAGVHALEQIAHFEVPEHIDQKKLFAGLFGCLPKDIRVLRIEEVPSSFHARYSAKQKTYQYRINPTGLVDPFERLYELTVFERFDIEPILEAIPLLLGKHDFTTFAHMATQGAASKDAVRDLYRIELIPKKEKLWIEFEGNGFLYKMVRNLVGLLLKVGSHKVSPLDIPTLLKAKDRRKAPQTAPAHALFLKKIEYGTLLKCP